MSLQNLSIVALGGALGSALRYLLSHYAQNVSQRSGFPLGTLAANVIGCFLIGVFASHIQKAAQFPETVRLLLIPGLLGGFTTYSAFAWESWSLANGPDSVFGWTYFALTTILTLGALAAGVLIARMIPS